jgi:small GTP-binding protein
MLVDGREGLVSGDETIARELREANKTVILAINKSDDKRALHSTMDFYRLGFEPVVEISAEHGDGVADLLDEIVKGLEAKGWGSDARGATDDDPAVPGLQPSVAQETNVAIVGRPNVGKSSLFNCLVERERAIVTPTPGTTRDLVSETVAIGGIPVKLVDTAGIRKALDEAEAIGIRKSMEALADADLVLVVLDASQAASGEDEELLRQADSRPRIVVGNKSDLAAGGPWLSGHRVRTSAVTGEGIPELREAILRHIGGEAGMQGEPGFLTNLRHEGLITDSRLALDAAKTAVRAKIPHEMLLLDLYNALRPLDAITGATTTDDILNLIFSRFCIGK